MLFYDNARLVRLAQPNEKGGLVLTDAHASFLSYSTSWPERWLDKDEVRLTVSAKRLEGNPQDVSIPVMSTAPKNAMHLYDGNNSMQFDYLLYSCAETYMKSVQKVTKC